MPGKVRSPEGTGCLTSGEVSPTASTPSYGLKSGEVPPDRGGGGRGGTKGRSKGGKCHREDELNQNQEVRAEIRMCLQHPAPKAEPSLLQGGFPVSCLPTRHSFAQETCSEVPGFLPPPFSAWAFHTPSLPSHQEIHPWTKSMSLRTNTNEQTSQQMWKEMIALSSLRSKLWTFFLFISCSNWLEFLLFLGTFSPPTPSQSKQ